MNEALNSASPLVIGRRVYCSLYGGKEGRIVAIHGEPAPASISSGMNGCMVMGGRADVDVVWDNGGVSHRLPEALVCASVQWKVLDMVESAEQIAKAVAFSAVKIASDKAKADEVVAIMKAAMAEAEKKGRAMGLIPAAEFQAAGMRGRPAVWNIRKHLKAAGIKARVKADGYNAVRVDVEDPSKEAEAKAIAMGYKAGRFDGMQDLYEYDPSAWGRVFGDMEYVWI